MTKKLLVRIPIFIMAMLTFTSCSEIIPLKLNLDKAYTFSAEIKGADIELTADFQRFSAGRWNVTLTEPFEIQGLTLYYKDGKVKASYAGIAIDISDVPEASAFTDKIIYAFENAVIGEGVEVLKTGDKIQASGNSDFGAYKFVFDGKTKLPISGDIPSAGISVKFMGVTVSNLKESDVASEEADVYSLLP